MPQQEPKKGTEQAVLALLKAQEGITENPPGSNRTKFGRLYGMDGYSWCAMFVWVILALWSGLNHIKSAYTPTVFEWYRNLGRATKKPAKMALVFYNFPDSLDRIQHIGFVIHFDDHYIWTIEGNTSSGVAGSQDDGGGAFPRQRPRDGSIVGYAHPFYMEAPKEVEFNFPVKAWFGKGDSGADIKNWKRDLNRYYEAKGFQAPLHRPVTNQFDQQTLDATKQFQSDHNLDVDGRVGQHTIEVMERIRDRQDD